jgi:PIN domain nuclease of toxin-antitoxin system
MINFVLDSSSLLRYVDNETGADRVEEILISCVSGEATASVSAVQWGEVAGSLRKRVGTSEEMHILSSLLPSEAAIVPVTAERAVHAAGLKVDRNIAYADAFALELAMESAEHVLVTADYGFKPVGDLARIEFLPLK